MRPVRTVGVRSPSHGTPAAAALVMSSLTVMAAAAVFDMLAGERPDHTVSLVLVAAIVGAVRWLLRGRLRGLFSLINLAVIAQPVAHGVNAVARDAAHLLPHSHVLPHEVPELIVQLTVALLVTVVAGSEPIAVFVASTVLTVAAVARAGVPDTAASGVRLTRYKNESVPLEADDPVRCRPHRGPPLSTGHTV